ncbi:hypothetical protein SAMN05421821_10695 [Mucilaginibacter lappiensis]|uniref:Uncharacterized protein n=1 Tax=Mucilaginibacter lappiensis TaxID=354630 RepID=A0ABR6PKJ7_9SPHI|nr:hypothetical protein [Mucilaginibacter lappiensis]MBB6110288.1 hypothetical protein [Mucilaginibacter lappiensis]SIR29250.1 hypothetical protein SAMN05421821_10695 [Mucilaginibacter lappiensis]
MGFTVTETITVSTASGPVIIETDKIEKIEKASDGGANVSYKKGNQVVTVLTVESFLRVIWYFTREKY